MLSCVIANTNEWRVPILLLPLTSMQFSSLVIITVILIMDHDHNSAAGLIGYDDMMRRVHTAVKTAASPAQDYLFMFL